MRIVSLIRLYCWTTQLRSSAHHFERSSVSNVLLTIRRLALINSETSLHHRALLLIVISLISRRIIRIRAASKSSFSLKELIGIIPDVL